MKLTFSLLILFFSLSAHAEKCEGIEACSALYTKLTGKKVVTSDIKEDMTLSSPGTDLTAENAEKEYIRYLNLNVVQMLEGNRLIALRHGEFLTSPIYMIEKGIMPQMINKDGLVTLVFVSKNSPKKLISKKVRNQLSRKKTKSINNIVEFNDNNIITLSDTYEYASRIMTTIMKKDSVK